MIQKFNALLETFHCNMKEAANREFSTFKQALSKVDPSTGEMRLVTAGNRAVTIGKGVYSDAGNRFKAASYFILISRKIIHRFVGRSQML